MHSGGAFQNETMTRNSPVDECFERQMTRRAVASEGRQRSRTGSRWGAAVSRRRGEKKCTTLVCALKRLTYAIVSRFRILSLLSSSSLSSRADV